LPTFFKFSNIVFNEHNKSEHSVKKGDFLDMLNLLDIGDCRIQCSVFSAIDAFQLETNLYGRCIKGTEVLRAAKCLFGLCQKCSGKLSTEAAELEIIFSTIKTELSANTCISGTKFDSDIPLIQDEQREYNST
jgi:hypothetical protein